MGKGGGGTSSRGGKSGGDIGSEELPSPGSRSALQVGAVAAGVVTDVAAVDTGGSGLVGTLEARVRRFSRLLRITLLLLLLPGADSVEDEPC